MQQNKRQQKTWLRRVKFMYENLPSWLKIKADENNKLNLRLANGSQIKATSASSDAGRSEAVSLLLIDEAAFIDNIGEIWASGSTNTSNWWWVYSIKYTIWYR